MYKLTPVMKVGTNKKNIIEMRRSLELQVEVTAGRV